MERPKFSNLVITQFVVAMCYLMSNTFMQCSHAIESPQYTVVHSESEFEVRLYKECSWMTALVRGTTSFEKSTKDGFHRLYQYIHGGNLNSTWINMSSPVSTTIMIASSSSAAHVSESLVRLYLPAQYERSPPQPLPELNLQLDRWKSHCIAVRKFSGFAKDDNVDKEVETLRNSLNNKHLSVGDGKMTPIQVEKSSYTIAQYNSSRHLSGRLNEVWLNVVSGFSAKGCLPYQGEDI